jgi:hypothetical protein
MRKKFSVFPKTELCKGLPGLLRDIPTAHKIGASGFRVRDDCQHHRHVNSATSSSGSSRRAAKLSWNGGRELPDCDMASA